MSKTDACKIISKGTYRWATLRSTSAWIGKKVLARSGAKVGRIRDLMYKDDVIKGILVSSLGKRVFIGKEYISEAAENSVMLSIDPVILLRGKRVFDADGRDMGKVIDVECTTNANTYASLKVRKGIRKAQSIPASQVDVARHNIILNTSYE